MASSKKKKQPKDNAVTVKSDASIIDIMGALEKKIAAFKEVEESKYHISGALNLPNGSFNIQEITDISTLIKIASQVLRVENDYNEYAFNTLGLSNFPVFKVGGHTAGDISRDVQLRIKVLQSKEELDRLKALREKAEKFMSVEDQKQMFMKELHGLL